MKTEDELVHQRRHPEVAEHEATWNWLYDSWEGGARYVNAVYGERGGFAIHNLRRHKRELPLKGKEVVHTAGVAADSRDVWEDDFEMRRDRTPPPDWVEAAADTHLSQIYAHEITRKGPPELVAFWRDVDGRGSTIDEWMEDLIGPLMGVLGQIDLICARPPDPVGEPIVSEGDARGAGLNRAIAAYILPQNVRWWKVDDADRYIECIIREYTDEGVRFRHWTLEDWKLYDADGVQLKGSEGGGENTLRLVPISRVYMRRKARCSHVGRGRYTTTAFLAREYYNRDSELILSDTTQAHPVLQGPEDYIKPDGTIPIGPNWLLPKKKTSVGQRVYYEGFEAITFPKDGAESLRQNKADLRDAADRDALLLKPAGAGAGGTGVGPIGQSGISKRLDQSTAHNFLAKFSTRLEAAERKLARMAYKVIVGDPAAEPAGLDIVYPKTFDLFTTEELAKSVMDYQLIMDGSGGSPEVEKEALKAFVRTFLPGRENQYRKFDREIGERVDENAKAMKQRKEAAPVAQPPPPPGAKLPPPPGVEAVDEDAEEDPNEGG